MEDSQSEKKIKLFEPGILQGLSLPTILHQLLIKWVSVNQLIGFCIGLVTAYIK